MTLVRIAGTITLAGLVGCSGGAAAEAARPQDGTGGAQPSVGSAGPVPGRGYVLARHNGVPTVFHNGKPLFANLYANFASYPKQMGNEHARLMRDAGVHMHHVHVVIRYGPAVRHAYAGLDNQIRAIRAMDPDARFLLRPMAWTPGSWYEEHPGELMAAEDGAIPSLGHRRRSPNSFASVLWKEETGRKLVEMIRHTRQTEYHDAIMGLVCMTGIEGQWTWWGLPVEDKHLGVAAGLETVDYSPAMRSYFRAWLRRKYDNDLNALRESWRRSDVTFESVAPPPEKAVAEAERHLFRDPASGSTHWVRDYFHAYRDCRFEALEYWGKAIKEETADSPWLYGGFIGAILANFVGGPLNYLRHAEAYGRVCRSPYIDFMAAPAFLRTRAVGEAMTAPALLDSLLLHNKTYFLEHDQTTHLNTYHMQTDTSEHGQPHTPATLEGTLAKLKRNFAAQLCKGRLGLWWWDQGLHQVRGNKAPQTTPVWYNDPAIHAVFGKLSAIGEDSLNHDCSSVSEIAVLFSEETAYCLNTKHGGLGRNLVIKQVREFGKMAAPFDLYEIGDLPRMRPYKLYVFWNAFCLTPEQRRLIDARIKRDGRTVLWLYAPGFVSDAGLSVDRVSELTGIQTAMWDAEVKLVQHVANTDHPIARGCAGQAMGRMNAPMKSGVPLVDAVRPFFFCDDPEATVLGSNAANGKPVFVVREFADWTSVYAGFYPIDARLLKNLARCAGVHVYSDHPDDVIYANASYLALHTSAPGERLLRLPRVRTVRDLLSEEDCPVRETNEIRLQIKGPTTRLFRIGTEGAPGSGESGTEKP